MPEFPNDISDTPASFETMTGPKVTVPVHFNPASLQHTVSNTLKEEGQGAKKKQYVSQTTAKLTMEQVQEMRQLRAEGVTTHEAAKRYGITQGAAAKVMRGDSWRDYSSPYTQLMTRRQA